MASSSTRGFSVLEALVMLAVSAVAVGLLIPVVGRGSAADFRLAESGAAKREQARAESTFRALVRAAAPAPENTGSLSIVSGDENRLQLDAYLDAPTLCTAKTGWARVTFWIERSGPEGTLKCRSDGREEALVAWTGGDAALAYKTRDGDWRPSALANNEPASFVRFTSTQSGDEGVVWIESLSPAAISGEAEEGRTIDGGGDLDR